MGCGGADGEDVGVNGGVVLLAELDVVEDHVELGGAGGDGGGGFAGIGVGC